VKDGKLVYTAFNRHMPSEYTYYSLGDPRNNFNAGERIDVSGAQHAEKVIISTAAAKGPLLAGSHMYVNTFPCPGCANDIVTAGITKVFYSEGYSLLQAEGTFRQYEVELIHVPI
jgi:dCMP deaminase